MPTTRTGDGSRQGAPFRNASRVPHARARLLVTAQDEFGFAVEVAGDRAVISALHGDSVGAVYSYRFNGASWDLEQKILAADGDFGDGFGKVLALEGGVLVIAATGDNDIIVDAGSAYVYEHDGSSWQFAQKILAPDAAEGDQFGWSVALAAR